VKKKVLLFTELRVKRKVLLFTELRVKKKSAGVGVGAFGCKLRELFGAAEEARADGREASQRTSTREVSFISFSLGFCVCLVCEASSLV